MNDFSNSLGNKDNEEILRNNVALNNLIAELMILEKEFPQVFQDLIHDFADHPILIAALKIKKEKDKENLLAQLNDEIKKLIDENSILLIVCREMNNATITPDIEKIKNLAEQKKLEEENHNLIFDQILGSNFAQVKKVLAKSNPNTQVLLNNKAKSSNIIDH